MKKADIITIALAVGFLIPILGVAGIIIHNDSVVGNQVSSPGMVYLQPGPDYTAVNRAGFISINGNSTASTNLSVTFTSPQNSGLVDLMNVFSITNNHPDGKIVEINLNGTLPPGVTVFISSSEVTTSGSSIQGNILLTLNGTFDAILNSSNHGTVFYLSFQVDMPSSSTCTFALDSYVK